MKPSTIRRKFNTYKRSVKTMIAESERCAAKGQENHARFFAEEAKIRIDALKRWAAIWDYEEQAATFLIFIEAKKIAAAEKAQKATTEEKGNEATA